MVRQLPLGVMKLLGIFVSLPAAALALVPSGRPMFPALRSTTAARPVRSVVTYSSPPGAGEVRKPRPKYVPGRIDDPDYVRVFDTTLRDGEQSPGATLVSVTFT